MNTEYQTSTYHSIKIIRDSSGTRVMVDGMDYTMYSEIEITRMKSPIGWYFRMEQQKDN